MTPGRIAGALAVLAVFYILALFFFPGMEGPYPAVHGPVTALLSLRAAARLRVFIRAGVRVARNRLGRLWVGLASLLQTADLSAVFLSNGLAAECPSVLRC